MISEAPRPGWPVSKMDGIRLDFNNLERSSDWLARRIYYLAAGLYFGAVLLRTVLVYQDRAILPRLVGLLLVWLALFICEPAISSRYPKYFPVYVACQTVLVFALLSFPGSSDFFAALLLILSMQVMLRIKPVYGAAWIGLCAVLLVAFLERIFGAQQAIALALIYTAGNVFLGTYTLAIRRAQRARAQNQSLAGELEEANCQLQRYSIQLEQLAAARERNRLARELHDSVTQTVFSMTLTTQSAILLLEREPGLVQAQLDRLNELNHSALSEMQALISELSPEKEAREGLVPSLRRHLAGRALRENLAISLEVEGDQPLGLCEEQGLFRIAQEAINNIVKHAQATQAQIRLHLAEPFWMEIEDHGKGFDYQRARNSGRVGLASMRERAAEIGWELQIITSEGAGTRIRVEKAPGREGQE